MPLDKNFKDARNILTAVAKQGKVQRNVVKEYLSRLIEIETQQAAKFRAERLKKTMSQLTLADKFSPTGYWKLKKAVNPGTRARDSSS